MAKYYRQVIVALGIIIVLLIATIGVISWCYIPIRFEDSPSEMHITRLDDIEFNFYDPIAGKLGAHMFGYEIKSSEVNLSDRIMLYDMLSDMEPTDVIPEIDDNKIGGMPALSAGVGNESSGIGIVCDSTRSYIRVRQALKSNQFANHVTTIPVYYKVNPDKVNKLITHLIARAEKLHPDYFGAV